MLATPHELGLLSLFSGDKPQAYMLTGYGKMLDQKVWANALNVALPGQNS